VTSDDIIYNCLPLYHSAGGILALGDMLFLGCTMVLRKKFSASKFFEDCTKYNCTVVQYIGEVCRYLLAQPVRDTDAANPVNIAVGNGLRPEIWNRFQTRFGISRVSEFYAATEGVSASCNHDNKPGAVGHVIISFPFPPSIILVKRDPQTGRYVRDDRGFLVQTGVNEPGELISPVDQSDQFRQYHGYSNRKATENKLIHNVFRQGDTYYKSGDVLRMDEEGYLYFCDRTGDTFRWKGENVSAAEVEGVMQKILGLKDVLVYGVVVRGADGRAGMAAINTDEDSLDISDLYRKLSVELPRYAVPIFIRLTSSVALTSTFKLKKTQAREEGYDLGRVSDPLFLLHPSQGRYVRLTPELVLELENGNLKL
jgi:solute carrier family 27 fatty acid transporter 1/4